MKKVFITREIPEAAENMLLNNNIRVVTYKKDNPITGKELIDKGKDAHGLITLLTDKIDKTVIDELPECRIIANYAVGFNNIDVEYARSKNIVVTNTPDILTDATADLAVTLVLACARHVLSGDRIVRNREFTGWKPKLLLGIELRNKTAGIIGAGRIGTETAKRLKAFGMKILYYNKSRKEKFETETGAKKVSLNYLLKNSDIISLHIPLSDDTYHLLNDDNLHHLKKTAILVNTARGEVIDEKILIRKLKRNEIFSAGFDVFENEPDVKEELLKLDNVVLLPHIGSATFAARIKMAELAAENIVNVLSGKKALTPV